MPILPDYLRTGLNIVFCGTAAGIRSATRGHYYAGPGNEFWRYLHDAHITSVLMSPDDDHRICEFGCGLTDLAKEVAASSDSGLKPHYAVAEFVGKIQAFRPQWVAFHGKEAARAVAEHYGIRGQVRLGAQAWCIDASRVFILPSASGANRDTRRLEGKGDRLEWFRELAALSSAHGVIHE